MVWICYSYIMLMMMFLVLGEMQIGASRCISLRRRVIFHIPTNTHLMQHTAVSSSLSPHPLMNTRYEKLHHFACLLTVVRYGGVVRRICICSDWRRAMLNMTLATCALPCSKRWIQPHYFRDRFSMEIWIWTQVLPLQWMAMQRLIEKVADGNSWRLLG